MNPFSDPTSDELSSLADVSAQQHATDYSTPQSAQKQSLGESSAVDVEDLPPCHPYQRLTPTLEEKTALVKSLKGKEKEWVVKAEKCRPMQLLDLPLDILKEIIDKVGFGGCYGLKIRMLTSHSSLTQTTSLPFLCAIPSSMRSQSPTFTPASTLSGPTIPRAPYSAPASMHSHTA
jgi:hypothetical protein